MIDFTSSDVASLLYDLKWIKQKTKKTCAFWLKAILPWLYIAGWVGLIYIFTLMNKTSFGDAVFTFLEKQTNVPFWAIEFFMLSVEILVAIAVFDPSLHVISEFWPYIVVCLILGSVPEGAYSLFIGILKEPTPQNTGAGLRMILCTTFFNINCIVPVVLNKVIWRLKKGKEREDFLRTGKKSQAISHFISDIVTTLTLIHVERTGGVHAGVMVAWTLNTIVFLVMYYAHFPKAFHDMNNHTHPPPTQIIMRWLKAIGSMATPNLNEKRDAIKNGSFSPAAKKRRYALLYLFAFSYAAFILCVLFFYMGAVEGQVQAIIHRTGWGVNTLEGGLVGGLTSIVDIFLISILIHHVQRLDLMYTIIYLTCVVNGPVGFSFPLFLPFAIKSKSAFLPIDHGTRIFLRIFIPMNIIPNVIRLYSVIDHIPRVYKEYRYRYYAAMIAYRKDKGELSLPPDLEAGPATSSSLTTVEIELETLSKDVAVESRSAMVQVYGQEREAEDSHPLPPRSISKPNWLLILSKVWKDFDETYRINPTQERFNFCWFLLFIVFLILLDSGFSVNITMGFKST